MEVGQVGRVETGAFNSQRHDDINRQQYILIRAGLPY